MCLCHFLNDDGDKKNQKLCEMTSFVENLIKVEPVIPKNAETG